MYFSPEQTIQFYEILFIFFCTVVGLQLLYVLFIHGGLLRGTKVDEPISNKTPVSIVICARNEATNLFKNLPSILEQKYPNFEVVIVNHQSTDDSKYILYAFQEQYKHLHVVEITRNQHLKIGKKLPLSMGIKGAKHEHILVTDADCVPDSDQWLASMSQHFSKKNEIVLGYSPYQKTKGFLNALIRFDTAWIGMNYLGAARNGMGYMGVGRNMAYKKGLFEKVNGFKSHYSILSGDDDLYFQAIAKKNYTINITPESFVYSEPKQNLAEWIQQKRRHLSTAPYYKVIKKLMLGIYPFTLYSLYLSFVILLFDEKYRTYALSAFLGLFLIKWLIQGKCFRKLNETSLVPFLPFMEIVYFSLLPIIYYGITNKSKFKWK